MGHYIIQCDTLSYTDLWRRCTSVECRDKSKPNAEINLRVLPLFLMKSIHPLRSSAEHCQLLRREAGGPNAGRCRTTTWEKKRAKASDWTRFRRRHRSGCYWCYCWTKTEACAYDVMGRRGVAWTTATTRRPKRPSAVWSWTDADDSTERWRLASAATKGAKDAALTARCFCCCNCWWWAEAVA